MIRAKNVIKSFFYRTSKSLKSDHDHDHFFISSFYPQMSEILIVQVLGYLPELARGKLFFALE